MSTRLPTLRELLPVAATAAVLAAGIVALFAVGAAGHAPASVDAFTRSYHQRVLHDPLEILIVQSDGQAFATLARDPTLARAEHEFGGEEAAYRAQRPLLPYAAWALSLGQPGWVPPALAGLAVLGTAAAAGLMGALLGRRRRWLGLAVILLPGTISALGYFGPEPLVLALLLGGLLAHRSDHLPAATALFAVAALGRETALVVPAVLALWELWRRRPKRALITGAVPLAVTAVWWAILVSRVGAGPWESRGDRLVWPFTGLWDVIDEGWTVDPTLGPLYAFLALALTVAVVVRAPRHPLTWVVVAHAALATVFGTRVWDDAEFFTRPLLPLYAFALVVLLAEGSRRDWEPGSPQPQGTGAAPPPPAADRAPAP